MILYQFILSYSEYGSHNYRKEYYDKFEVLFFRKLNESIHSKSTNIKQTIRKD